MPPRCDPQDLFVEAVDDQPVLDVVLGASMREPKTEELGAG